MSDSASVDEADTVAWYLFAREAEQKLTNAGIAAARQESRWLVEEAAGIEPGEWHHRSVEPARVRGVVAFDEMLARRLAGEPIQYVLGRWAFRTLDLVVDRRVLIPRPETEGIVDLGLEALARTGPSRPVVVELGTGSGAIALSMAVEHPKAVVVATDISSDALSVARANLAGLGRAGTRVRLVEGSWFEPLDPGMGDAVDLVLSNPPYVRSDETLPPSVRDWEPENALVAGPRGVEYIEHILDGARRWLSADGSVILEMASDQTSSAAEFALSVGYGAATISADLAGRPRFLVASMLGTR